MTWRGWAVGGYSWMKQDETIREPLEAEEPEASEAPRLDLKAAPRTFTLGQRIQLILAEWLGYLIVLLIGRSLRWEVYGKHHYDEAVRRGKVLL